MDRQDRQDRHILQQDVVVEMMLEAEQVRIDQKSCMCADDAINWFSGGW
jgi:hypothetical protein